MVRTEINQNKFSFVFLTDVHLNQQNRGRSNDGLCKTLEDTKRKRVSLVLQGHQHSYEEINERQCWFITGGAVCAN